MCSLKATLAFHLLPFASSPSSPCFLIFSPIFLPLLPTPYPWSNLYITNSSPTFSWKPSELDTNNQTTIIRCDMQNIFNINISQVSSNQSMGMHQSQVRKAPCCARFNSLIPGIQEGEVARFGGRGCSDQRRRENAWDLTGLGQWLFYNWDRSISIILINSTGSITTQCRTLRLIAYMCLNSRKPSVRVGDSPHGFQIRLKKTRQ